MIKHRIPVFREADDRKETVMNDSINIALLQIMPMGSIEQNMDIAMLREYRKREAQNLRNRRPELYGILAER